MAGSNVPPGDMTPEEFSDDDAEAIISGFAPREPELGAALDDLRSAFAAIEPPTASGELSEFIVRGADPAPATAGAAAVPMVELDGEPTPVRRRSVFASLSAFAGTALGKICIGTTVAAASVGGASAVGIDTPITAIFDDDSAVETQAPDTDDAQVDDTLDDGPSDDTAVDDSTSDDSTDSSSDDSVSDDSPSDDSTDDSAVDDSGDDSVSDDSVDSTSTTVPSDSSPAPAGTASVTHVVDGVGTVSFTYDSGVWTLIAATPTGSWSVDEAGIDAEGVDVRFVSGPVEIDVDTEIEDGQIRLRVRVDNDDTDERTETFFWYALS